MCRDFILFLGHMYKFYYLLTFLQRAVKTVTNPKCIRKKVSFKLRVTRQRKINYIVFDSKLLTSMTSLEMCIIGKRFLTIFGLIMTLTYDQNLISSSLSPTACNCKFGEIPISSF